MSTIIPAYDYKIDIDGQLVTTPAGVDIVTDVDLIRQHARNVLMLNFRPSDYMSLPNNESTGAILREEISEILEKDVLLKSLDTTVIVNVYPKDLNSIGFSVLLTCMGNIEVDLGVDGFLNLRAGILIGIGDYKLEPTVYNKQTIVKAYERIYISKKSENVALTRPLVPGKQVFILGKDKISGFVDNFPVPVSITESGSFQINPSLKLIALSDFLQSGSVFRVYNITLTDSNGDVVPENQYSVVGSYLIFDGITITDTVTAVATLVDVDGDVVNYTETVGIHPVDIYPSSRENKEYLVTLSGNIPNGTYFIIYDSFEVIS